MLCLISGEAEDLTALRHFGKRRLSHEFKKEYHYQKRADRYNETL